MIKIITFFTFLVIFPYSSFAEELWNGFTTEMNKQQVITRARAILKCREDTLYQCNSRLWEEIDRKHPNYSDLPKYDSFVQFKSKLVEYQQTEYEPDANVIFMFYKNKLFVVEIHWAADGPICLELARTKFGQPFLQKNFTENFYNHIDLYSYNPPSSQITYSIWSWETNTKLVTLQYIIGKQGYSGAWEEQGTIMDFINTSIIKSHKKEQHQKEKKRIEAEEKRKLKAAEGIKFQYIKSVFIKPIKQHDAILVRHPISGVLRCITNGLRSAVDESPLKYRRADMRWICAAFATQRLRTR